MEHHRICKVHIPSYRFYDKAPDIVLFQIDFNIASVPGWRLEKRYSDFYDFHTVLSATFQYLPTLPGKSLTPLKEHSDLEKRRLKLQQYLQELCLRMDIISSEPFDQFFTLQTFAPKLIFEPPKLQLEITGFDFTLRDFLYFNDDNLLFAATFQTAVIQQMDALISNSEQMKTPLGSIELWQFQADRMVKTWSKQIPTMAICLSWSHFHQVLVAGTEKGSIYIFYLKGDVTNSGNHSEFQHHQGRVTGVYIDDRIHSVSKDGYYRITTLEGIKPKSSQCLKDPLSALEVCPTRQLAFIGSEKGAIYIYDIGNSEPLLISKLMISKRLYIRSIAVDTNTGYLFAGCEEGAVQVVEISKQGKERHAKLCQLIRTNQKTRQVSISRKNRYLFVGDSHGQLQIVSAVNGEPLFSFKAHDDFITKTRYAESEGLLFTAAKKSGLKLWSMPQNWPNLQELKSQAAQEIREENLTQQKQQLKMKQNGMDSDEEAEGGLNDWHK